MSKRVIAQRVKDASVKAYLKGEKIGDIASAVGVGYESVRRWVMQAGHNTSRKPSSFYDSNTVSDKNIVKKKEKGADRHNTRWTPDEEDMLRDAVLSGLTTKETAELLSRSKASIACRKVHLIDRGVIPNPDARFIMPEDIKRPRVKETEAVVEDVVEETFEPVNDTVNTETPKMNIPELGDLAKIVKEYGVNVTLNLTSSGMQVTMTN
jgi:transposase